MGIALLGLVRAIAFEGAFRRVLIAVGGRMSDSDTRFAIGVIRKAFRPNQVVAFHDPSAGSAPDFIPLLKDKPMVDGKVTVYVCENFACKEPLVGAEAVENEFR